MSATFADQVHQIVIGGVAPADLYGAGTDKLAASLPRGQGWTRTLLGTATEPEIWKVTPDLKPDERVLALLGDEPERKSFALPPAPPEEKLTDETPLDGGATLRVQSSEPGDGEGLVLRVLRAQMEPNLDGEGSSSAMARLTLHIEVENDIDGALAYGGSRDAGERLRVVQKQKLFLVHGPDGRSVAPRLLPEGPSEGEGRLPQDFVLNFLGDVRAGTVTFELSKAAIEAGPLQLRWYHDEVPMASVMLRGTLAPDSVEEVAANELVRWADPTVQFTDTLDGDPAPTGMRWATVEFRGRATGEAATVYLEAETHLEVMEDGLWPRRRVRSKEALNKEPVFLPDRFTGGSAVFLVDAKAKHLALVAAFPLFVLADGTRVPPTAIRRPLLGNPLKVRPATAAIQIEDGPVQLGVHRAERAQTHGRWSASEGRSLLVVEADLRQTQSEQDGRSLFGCEGRLSVDEGRHLAITDRLGRALEDPILLPDGAVRRFCVVLDVPMDDNQTQTVHYSGVTRRSSFEIELGAAPEPSIEALDPAPETADLGPPAASTSATGTAATEPVPEPTSAPVNTALADHWTASATRTDSIPVDLAPGSTIDTPGRVDVVDGVSLAVHRATASAARGDDDAPEGQVYLTIDAEIKVDPDQPPLVIGKYDKLLFGVENGAVEQAALSGKLPTEFPKGFTVEPGTSLTGQLAFLVDSASLCSFSLEFLPPGRRGLHVDVLDAATKPAPPVATGKNDSFRMQLLGFSAEEMLTADGEPSGTAELRADLRVAHQVASDNGYVGRIPWIFGNDRVQLVLDGTHGFPVYDWEGREMTSPCWTFPDVTLGAQAIFRVPKDLLAGASSAHLACGFERYSHPESGLRDSAPIRLNLVDAASEAALGDSDFEAAGFDHTLGIVARGSSSSLAGYRKWGGYAWVAFDLSYVGHPTRDAVVAPNRDVAIVTKEGRRIPIQRATWQQPANQLGAEPLWLPAGGIRQLSVAFSVPVDDVEGAAIEVRSLLGSHLFPITPGAPMLAPGLDRSRASDGQLVHDPSKTPRGIEGVGLTARDVNESIRRGRDRLWELVREESAWWKNEKNLPAMLALHHSGATEEYPEFRLLLDEGLDAIDPRKLGVYALGVVAMLLGNENDPGRAELLERTVRLLVESQAPNGSWGYSAKMSARLASQLEPVGALPPRLPIGATEESTVKLNVNGGEAPTDREGEPKWIQPTQSPLLNKGGDNSITQFAVLGLQAAVGDSLRVASRTWESALRLYHARQRNSNGESARGGFGYTVGAPYGSMVCAGICSLAITLNQMDEEVDLQHDLRIRDGLGWLVRNWSVVENPGKRKSHHYYYLYGLERVGRLLELDFIGEHEWYPEGARFLVDAQNIDGSWTGSADEGDPRIATSFALLFLTKATPKLKSGPEETDPETPGLLNTLVPEVPATDAIYVIFDASGSMLGKLDGTTRFDLARQSLEQLVDSLPDGIDFGLRAYGHRKRAIEEGANEDTELLVPLATLDRAKVRAATAGLRPRGKTPLTLSMEETIKDLRSVPSAATKTVILLSDGGEDTRRDPIPVAKRLGSMSGVSLHVLGLHLTRAAWETQLRTIAESAGGTFLGVQEGAELNESLLELALPQPPPFSITDDSGRKVAEGQFGDQVELKAGAYEISFQWRGSEFRETFHIRPGKAVDMFLSLDD